MTKGTLRGLAKLAEIGIFLPTVERIAAESGRSISLVVTQLVAENFSR